MLEGSAIEIQSTVRQAETVSVVGHVVCQTNRVLQRAGPSHQNVPKAGGARRLVAHWLL